MPFDELNFARPYAFTALALIPIIWLLFLYAYKSGGKKNGLGSFIDSHLLQYLLVSGEKKKGSLIKSLALFTAAYTLLLLALAGPRWDFREIETYSSDQNLVILLDLSQSMEADDAKPTRLSRAKQQIEELLREAKDLKVGLIAFAADPHMITPLTRDLETLRHILPSLDTKLVYVQGSRLTPALDMAEAMMKRSSGRGGAILVVSDGGFEDASAISRAKELRDEGISLYAVGVGTEEGAPIRDQKGEFIKSGGKLLLSKLEREKLEELSKSGGGAYFTADYSGALEKRLLSDLERAAGVERRGVRKVQLWEESFYLFILPVLPLLLFWIRRGAIIPLVALTLLPSAAYSDTFTKDYFMNSEERGSRAMEEGDYKGASETFTDPYRRGVAYYRAGSYSEAEAMFRQPQREEVAREAAYNLGNALAKQNKLKEAADAYEKVLEKWPDDKKAADNLALVKKMLEEEKKEQQQNKERDKEKQRPNRDKSDSGEGENEEQNREEERDKGESQESEKSERGEGGEETRDKEKESHEQKGEQPEGASEKEPLEGKKEQQVEEQQVEEQQEGQEEKRGETPMAPGKEAPPSEKGEGGKKVRTQEDRDADRWLNRIQQKPEEFLKNKFYIESKKNGTRENPNPW